MSETRFREWRFPSVAGGKKKSDAKNYAVIQYKTLRGTWSKPIRVGSVKFKKMLLDERLNIKDFPQYKISQGGRYGSYVYFDQNNLRSIGRQVKSSVLTLGGEDNDQKKITYTLMFYAKLSDLSNRMGGRKGFRLDRYSHDARMIDGQKAYPLFHRKFHIVLDFHYILNNLRDLFLHPR